MRDLCYGAATPPNYNEVIDRIRSNGQLLDVAGYPRYDNPSETEFVRVIAGAAAGSLGFTAGFGLLRLLRSWLTGWGAGSRWS